MISDDEAGHQVSYWPSISDLFMTLFIIAIALVGVVLFVFLVNPYPDKVFRAIIDLRTSLYIEPVPLTNDERSDNAIIETIRRAIEEIKACKQLSTDVNALASCQREVNRLAGENRELATLREQRAALLTLLMAVMARLPADPGGPGQSREALEGEIADLREKLAASEQQRKMLEAEIARRNDKPPIITIGSDVLFASGGATVNHDASAGLWAGGFQQIAKEILARNANGARMVDTLEIIGHTDSQPMKAVRGNLDTGLPAVLAGTTAIVTLRPGSNNDLGLLRALAIKQNWQVFVALHPDRAALEPIAVRTYSAGQTLPFDPDGPVDDARSRRIELRLTKLGDGPPNGAPAAVP